MGPEAEEGIKDNPDFELEGPDARVEEEFEQRCLILPKDQE